MRGEVPSREALVDAAHAETGEAGIAAWVEQALEGDPERAADARLRARVRRRRARPTATRLAAIRDRLAGDRRRRPIRSSAACASCSRRRRRRRSPCSRPTARRSSTSTSTCPRSSAGASASSSIGGETQSRRAHAADLAASRRDTVVRPGLRAARRRGRPAALHRRALRGPEPPAGPGGHLLRHAVEPAARRAAQRPRDPPALARTTRCFLTTMLPEPGELEELLGLETLVRAKIRAAGVYGMEVEVIDGASTSDLRHYAERLAGGDDELLDEERGRALRRVPRRAAARAARPRACAKASSARPDGLPWGIGAGFRQTAAGRSTRRAGRLLRDPYAADGRRAGRLPVLALRRARTGEAVSTPTSRSCAGSTPTEASRPTRSKASTSKRRGQRAAASIVDEHNRRADPRAAQERDRPAQRCALDLLRDPGVAFPPAPRTPRKRYPSSRSSAVRRALGAIETSVHAGDLTIDEAAVAIVGVVEQFGLQAVEPPSTAAARYRRRSRRRLLDGGAAAILTPRDAQRHRPARQE